MSLDNVQDVFALIPMQEGMLFHTLAEPGTGVFVQQISCVVKGEISGSRLRSAWDSTVARHAALRSAFLWEGLDEPLQVVRQEVQIPWVEFDWREIPESARQRQLAELLADERRRGFELSQAPLMRMTAIWLSDDSWRWIWNFHHILCDGWSVQVVLRDWLSACRGEVPGPVPVPWCDYLTWLQSHPTDPERYWKGRLQGFGHPTRVSVSSDEPIVGAARSSQQRLRLTRSLSAELREFARASRVTLNTLVQGAWAQLLSRYSDEEEIVFGVTVSGRPPEIEGIENAVGLYINTLPVRVNCVEPKSVAAWLGDLQQQLIQLMEWQHSSLADVQACSDIDPGQSLFDSIVVFENYPERSSQHDDTVKLVESDYFEQSNYPLALLVVPGEELELILVHDTTQYSEQAATRMLEHVSNLLGGFPKTEQILELPLLSEAEHTEQLALGNRFAPQLDDGPLIHERIQQQAQDKPEAVAVIFDDQQLTYGELDARADMWARAIHARATAAGPIGICFEKSIEAIVAVVAILKTGRAYLPLDPRNPSQRLLDILGDAGAPLVLTQSRLRDRIDNQTIQVLELDTDPLPDAESVCPTSQVDADATAYIIYTSGSTGSPKGVAVTHRNLLYSTQARYEYYGEVPERFLLLSSFAFDSSVAGIFWTLCGGGTLVLPAERLELDVAALAELVEQQRVTHTLCLPSLYELVLGGADAGKLASMRAVIVAGEACSRQVVRAHLAKLPTTKLFNEYGPTETTVWCTVHEIKKDSPDGVPIGRAIPGARTYVLDKQLRMVPSGVSGELYVGGPGVTNGYRNQAALTQERYIADPFVGLPGERIYRTGDLVCARGDGVLVFQGRRDGQAKIRGFRIETEEVTAVLKSHPLVKDATTVIRQAELNAGENDSGRDGKLAARLSRLDPQLVEQLLLELEGLSEHEVEDRLAVEHA